MAANISVEVVVKVPFYDIDPMGVVWHGHYFKYFEIARCALLDKIQYNYPQMRDSGFMWPVVDTRVKYVGSALFQQEITVRAEIVEYENRLKIAYRITDQVSGKCLTKGYTIQVAVDMATKEMCFVSPDALRQRIEEGA